MFRQLNISRESDSGLSADSSSVCGAANSQFSTLSSLISLRTWCSTEIWYMRPRVLVSDTYSPACANVFGVQISANVPPPPSVTHRLGYWLSQRLRESASVALWLFVAGLTPLP